MKKIILRHFITLLIISLSLTTILDLILISRQYLSETEQQMLYILKLADYSIDYTKDLNKQISRINPLTHSKNTRLSIISNDGRVLADTYKKYISENHSSREEIKKCLKSKKHFGSSIRKSDTTNEQMLYTAYYHNGYILRIAVVYQGIAEYWSAIMPAFLISTIVSFVLSYILARLLSQRVSQPLYEISESLENMSDDYRFSLKQYDYEEYNTIVETIKNLSHRLRKANRAVQLGQAKVDAIIKQMNEGFILLDEKNMILSINRSAISILGPLKEKESIQEHIQDDVLIKAIDSKEEYERIELRIKGLIYRVYISKLPFGKALFFVDITAARTAAKIREEFFSSASHELKTPLTSIRGYSELLSAGVIKDHNKEKEILSKIQVQVTNMANLINDILMLSRLDNHDIAVEKIPLHMKAIISGILKDYEGLTLEDRIELIDHSEDIIYYGNTQQITTLISNLVSNAIKYNIKQGTVIVSCYREKNMMILSVKDTGIGIPEDSKDRVFERFYRVDKGRSRTKGGTGLGLAIVKHIVAYYQGTIEIFTKEHQGTEIIIKMPIMH